MTQCGCSGCFLAGMVVLLLTSCADDGFEDETFSSGISNTQMTAIVADQITFTPTTDGSKTVIAWPVVYGASGYQISVFDVTNPEAPVAVDSLESATVDGCSVAVTRAEDTNYQFSILVLGNAKEGNTDAADPTVVTFSSFTPTYVSIPDGTDLYAYFQEHPLPTDTTGNLNFDLVNGGNYTLSQSLDFEGQAVTLRTPSKTHKASITYAGETSIQTAAPITLKNISLDCSASSEPVFKLSKNAPDSIKGATGSGDYYNIIGAMYLSNCDFTGVNALFLYDNNVKYCLETFLMDNCTVQLTTGDAISGQANIYFRSGFIKDCTIRNSSWWNVGTGDSRYFVQYNNSGRLDRAGYDRKSQTQSFTYTGDTFYNICKSGQWGNYGGFSGQTYSAWTVQNNIWVDCGNGQISRRMLGGRNASSYATCVFNNNTYWFNGAAETGNTSYDTGYQLQSDPALVNPAEGDLTPTGAEQISLKTGDPRWLTNE